MASRRGTNNSSVSNLEEQTEVIDQVVQAATNPEASTSRPIEKVKVSGKKKIAKAKSGKEGAPLRARDARDVPGKAPDFPEGPGSEASRPDRQRRQLADVTRSTTDRGDGISGRSVMEAWGPDGLRGNQPDDDLGAEDLLAHDPIVDPGAGQGGVGLFGNTAPFLFDNALWQQQQQWMLQQQMLAFQAWQQQPQEEEQETEPVTGESGQVRQAVHEISEDEADLDEVVVAHVQAPSVTQAQSGQSAGHTETLVQGELAVVKDADRVAPDVGQGVADLLERYLREANSLAEMEKLAKDYPRVGNVNNMKVPRLEEEVFSVVEQKVRNGDMALQGIQKGVLAAMAAFAPVMDLVFKRSKEKSDDELDKLGLGVVDGFKVLAQVHNAISGRRREMLKPQLSPAYARAMSRAPELVSQEWLYGGNLEETTKQCEVSKRIAEKVIGKRKPQQTRGQNNNKRFRPQNHQPAPFPAQFSTPTPMLRAYNPFQFQHQQRFPTPQNFQAFQPQFYPQQQWMGGFPRRQRFNNRPQRQQGFAKRGPHR